MPQQGSESFMDKLHDMWRDLRNMLSEGWLLAPDFWSATAALCSLVGLIFAVAGVAFGSRLFVQVGLMLFAPLFLVAFLLAFLVIPFLIYDNLRLKFQMRNERRHRSKVAPDADNASKQI